MKRIFIMMIAVICGICCYAADNATEVTAVATTQAPKTTTKKEAIQNKGTNYIRLGARDYSPQLKYMLSDRKRYCNNGGVDSGFSEGYDPYFDMSAELMIIPKTIKVLSVDTTNGIVKIRASVKSVFNESNYADATYT